MGNFARLVESTLGDELEIEDLHLNSHHGQHDFRMVAWDRVYDLQLGFLDYAEFRGAAHVNFIKVPPQFRRQGVGKRLVQALERKYGKKRVNPGMMTPEGTSLFRSMGYRV